MANNANGQPLSMGNISLMIKEHFLCSITCLINLFFMTLLTLGAVYGYYVMSSESDGVKLCTSAQIINGDKNKVEEIGKISCCNDGKGFAFGLCKIVEKTTQATIILIVVVFAYLSLEAYCGCGTKRNENPIDGTGESQKGDPSEKRRGKLIKALTASLGASAIPTGISLVICAFYDMKWMQLLLGVEAYIAFAGVSIISIAFLSVFHEEEALEKENDKSLSQMQQGAKSPPRTAAD